METRPILGERGGQTGSRDRTDRRTDKHFYYKLTAKNNSTTETNVTLVHVLNVLNVLLLNEVGYCCGMYGPLCWWLVRFLPLDLTGRPYPDSDSSTACHGAYFSISTSSYSTPIFACVLSWTMWWQWWLACRMVCSVRVSTPRPVWFIAWRFKRPLPWMAVQWTSRPLLYIHYPLLKQGAWVPQARPTTWLITIAPCNINNVGAVRSVQGQRGFHHTGPSSPSFWMIGQDKPAPTPPRPIVWP